MNTLTSTGHPPRLHPYAPGFANNSSTAARDLSSLNRPTENQTSSVMLLAHMHPCLRSQLNEIDAIAHVAAPPAQQALPAGSEPVCEDAPGSASTSTNTTTNIVTANLVAHACGGSGPSPLASMAGPVEAPLVAVIPIPRQSAALDVYRTKYNRDPSSSLRLEVGSLNLRTHGRGGPASAASTATNGRLE